MAVLPVIQLPVLLNALRRIGCRLPLWIPVVVLLPLNAAAKEYTLGPQDKLRVRIVEWRASKAEYFDWSILAGEYTVGPTGSIALPLIGTLPATGMTVDDFASSVAEILQRRAGIPNRPEATVEIVQFRPIYVVGNVQNSGEYAYRPGLTVLQAIGLAGGFFRQTDAVPPRFERDQITATGAYEVARLETRRLLIRRARLSAELVDTAQINIPDELRNDTDAPRLVSDERALMNARMDELRSKLAANSELKNLFLKEIEALERKIAVQDRQVTLARREQQTISTLVDKGLAVSSREFIIERTLADLESKMLDYTTAMLRARQEVNKAEQTAVDLKADHKSKIVEEIQQVETQLEQLKARLTTTQGLVNEAANIAPRLMLDQQSKQYISFWIVRGNGENATKTAADENTSVEPGDVVRVELVTEGESLREIPGFSSTRETLNPRQRDIVN